MSKWLGNAVAGDINLGETLGNISLSKVGQNMIDGINNVGKSALEKLPSADKILADKELTKLPIDQLQKIINEKETNIQSQSGSLSQDPQPKNDRADQLFFVNGQDNGFGIINIDDTKGLL